MTPTGPHHYVVLLALRVVRQNVQIIELNVDGSTRSGLNYPLAILVSVVVRGIIGAGNDALPIREVAAAD